MLRIYNFSFCRLISQFLSPKEYLCMHCLQNDILQHLLHLEGSKGISIVYFYQDYLYKSIKIYNRNIYNTVLVILPEIHQLLFYAKIVANSYAEAFRERVGS